jgi:DNA polymerase/3'-5' exonuclease PolX
LLLETARLHAAELADLLRPYCKRIEVAGGVRREKPEPHDMELVVTPRVESNQLTIEGHGTGDRDCLLEALACRAGTKGSDLQRGPRDKAGKEAPFGRRCYRVLWKGEKVDIFAVLPPAQFGVIYTARTGDAGFTQSLYGVARSKGMRFVDGSIQDQKGNPLRTPEEEDVFRVLGLPWLEPRNRSFHGTLVSSEEEASTFR